MSSPTYNLSKHVAKILKPLTGNSANTVKTSTEFCGSIADVNLQDDDDLVSFDVVSLFTSIPVDVAVNVAHNRLVNDENLQESTALPVTDIIELLDFCLSTTNFQYFQPLFWKRFVDDVSTTTKPDSTQTFLEHLNSIEPCIKFIRLNAKARGKCLP